MKTITPDLDEYFNHVISVLDRRLWEAERIAHSEIAESGGFITKIFTLGEAAAHLATVRRHSGTKDTHRLTLVVCFYYLSLSLSNSNITTR